MTQSRQFCILTCIKSPWTSRSAFGNFQRNHIKCIFYFSSFCFLLCCADGLMVFCKSFESRFIKIHEELSMAQPWSPLIVMSLNETMNNCVQCLIIMCFCWWAIWCNSTMLHPTKEKGYQRSRPAQRRNPCNPLFHGSFICCFLRFPFRIWDCNLLSIVLFLRYACLINIWWVQKETFTLWKMMKSWRHSENCFTPTQCDI